MSDIHPFVVSELQPGSFSLILDDEALLAVIGVFRERGREGNGQAWSAIAVHLLHEEAPELAAEIEQDPEAGMYAAYSANAGALERLGGLMAEVYRDRVRLGELIDELGDELDD